MFAQLYWLSVIFCNEELKRRPFTLSRINIDRLHHLGSFYFYKRYYYFKLNQNNNKKKSKAQYVLLNRNYFLTILTRTEE